MRGSKNSRCRWVHQTAAVALAGVACQPVPAGSSWQDAGNRSAAAGVAADLLLELVSLCALGDAASVVDPCSELVTDFDSVWGAGTSPGIVDGPPGEALPSAPPQGPESEDFDVESLLDLLLEGTGGGL